MTTKHDNKKDYISMWFDVRKEQGINDDMSAGPMNTVTQSVKWHQFRHRDMDGLGGLAKILRQHGYPSRVLPSSSDRHQPTFFQLIKLMFKMPKVAVPKRIKWLKTYPDYQQLNPANTNDAPISSGLFSEQDTQEIQAQARKHRVALSIYLFWALNKSIADNLLDGHQEYYWFYPVNLRGAVNFNDDTQNCSSGVNVHLSNSIAPKEIQSRIKLQLKAKAHWVLWWQANIGKLIGMKGVRFIYKLISGRQFYAGSFSFLGSWPLRAHDNPPTNLDEAWVACGIGTENYPVSTGILIWNNQLTLGLKLHPYICNDVVITDQCMRDWKHNLLTGHCSNESEKTV